MIKAVLFDFGGVLSEAGGPGSIRSIFGRVYGLDLNVMNIHDATGKMWRGQISDEAYLKEIKRRNPGVATITPDEFRAQMDNFARSEPVYAMAEALRKQGIKTAILSNVFGIGVGALRGGGFYDGFDPVILSCEIGMAKPDQEIYDLSVKMLGIKPQEIIFIDDQQLCLDPAAKMGMHTVLAENPDQIVRDTWRIIEAERKV